MDDCTSKICDERFGRDKERLNAIEITLAKVAEMIAATNASIIAINATLDRISISSADHEKRLRQIESKPASRWEKVIAAAITAIIGGGLGAVLTLLFTKGGL